MTTAVTNLEASQIAALAVARVRMRHRIVQAERLRPVPDVVEWARENCRIIHPIRGPIRFEPYDYQKHSCATPRGCGLCSKRGRSGSRGRLRSRRCMGRSFSRTR